MSDLVAIAYPDQQRAEEVLGTLRRLQKEYLIDLEDACIVTRDQNGQVRLHQMVNLTAAGALGGGFWGLLIGTLFLNPLLGAALGAGAGALSGSATDLGINDDFMRQLGASLPTGSSALFILIRKSTPDKVLPELGRFGGTVLRTSLSHEDERALRNALSGAAATSDTPVITPAPSASGTPPTAPA